MNSSIAQLMYGWGSIALPGLGVQGDKIVQPPNLVEILYVYFVFFISIFILNAFFCLDLKEKQYDLKAAFLYALGSFVLLIAFLSPDIFIYTHRGIHYETVAEHITLNAVFFALIFTGYVRAVSSISSRCRQQYLNSLYIISANFLWIIPLTAAGRAWYWSPSIYGYYMGIYSLILYYYLPVLAVMFLLRTLSIKLAETKTDGLLGKKIEI